MYVPRRGRCRKCIVEYSMLEVLNNYQYPLVYSTFTTISVSRQLNRLMT